MNPYIGVCDVATSEQALRLAALIPPNFSHQLMVGVMMSRKTLNDLPTKWADVFPQKGKIRDIFIDDQRALNTIHYADYEIGPDRDQNLCHTLISVAGYGGQKLDAIQLDMIWPDPEELMDFHHYFGIPVVLQVGSDAMKQCNDDPSMVCKRLLAYHNAIDCVLFDKSMGKGKGLDAALLATYIGALTVECPNLLPAFAGGLGPTSMSLAKPLIDVYPNISIDAQSKLRPSGDAKDPIDLAMSEEYVRRSVAMFRR